MEYVVSSVGSIRTVKYLYKYIHKGLANIEVVENQRSLNYIEADSYTQRRCFTPLEAYWRLFQRLDIDLPGQFRKIIMDQAQED